MTAKYTLTDETKTLPEGIVLHRIKRVSDRRLITYTMQSEPGTSLVAAGWKVIGKTKARSWDMPSRPRVDKHVVAPRLLWEIS